MKKISTVFLSLMICATAFVFVGCGTNSSNNGTVNDAAINENNQAVQETVKTNSTKFISEKKAKNIALKDAGVSSAKANFFRVALEKDDGKDAYEVEFYNEKTEYDYDIDAVSGDIISKDSDAESYSIPKGKGNITESKAKSVALKDAKLSEKDTKYLNAKLDTDDGIKVWDVEFRTADKEYEYEIDATTGKVIQSDWEKYPN